MTDIEEARAVEETLGGHRPTKVKGQPLVLVIEEEGGKHTYGGYYHINGRVAVGSGVKNADRHDIAHQGFAWPSYQTEVLNGLYLKGLTVTCQGDNDGRKEGKLYAWRFGYKTSQTILAEVEELEKMAKSLRAIEKRIDKTRQRFGPATTFVQYLGYFAAAIGAAEIAIKRGQNTQGLSPYRMTDVENGLATVFSMIATWQAAD